MITILSRDMSPQLAFFLKQSSSFIIIIVYKKVNHFFFTQLLLNITKKCYIYHPYDPRDEYIKIERVLWYLKIVLWYGNMERMHDIVVDLLAYKMTPSCSLKIMFENIYVNFGVGH
jgi:hypothetical protein